MIYSILDNDLYKFTMQQAVHRLYPWAEAQYVFINRGGTEFPDGFVDGLSFQERLRVCITQLAELSISEEEIDFLKQTCPFLTPVYLDYLRTYRFAPKEVTVGQQGTDLSITIKGPWYRTILWEVPLMAMISELYFREEHISSPYSSEELEQRNKEKGRRFAKAGLQLADFGTRRRFSRENQLVVLLDLLNVENSPLIGTSNVAFAHELGIKPIGTHAHEWFMFHGAVHGYLSANQTALDAWIEVYHGDLGIALTDTYTTDVFFDSFDSVKARLFDGVRHDSGDPVLFAEKVIDHYKKLGIDPLSKTIVFSDSLTTEKAVQLHHHCEGRIKCSFGIGTHLTNDVGVKPLNMVIKMTRCCMRPSGDPWLGTVKLSDSPGKHTGQPQDVDLCVQTLVF